MPKHEINESSAAKFGDRTAPLSGAPFNNEVKGQNMNITNTAPAATYVHEVMSDVDFYNLVGDSPFTFVGENTYSHVEYLNSPKGLIVLAHQATIAGQVDGIHPADISASIEWPNNIVEPLTADDGDAFPRNPIAYNSHWMNRRSQGDLVVAAFGRMVDGGSSEASCIAADDDSLFSLMVYDTPTGPLIGVMDDCSGDVHVIRPKAEVKPMRRPRNG